MAEALVLHAPVGTDERSGRLFPVVSRECRVICLLVAVLLMSLVDLHNTLLYLRTLGMEEVNPVARFVISQDSPILLVCFKMATVVIAGAILLRLRRKAVAEVGAWVCAGVLTWLTLHWGTYTNTMLEMGELIELAQSSPNWVMMSP